MCLNYFVVTLDQKTITTNKTNIPYEKGICNIQREIDDVIFLAIFPRSTHRTRKQMTYLEASGCSAQETCAFMLKILISKFDLTFT